MPFPGPRRTGDPRCPGRGGTRHREVLAHPPPPARIPLCLRGDADRGPGARRSADNGACGAGRGLREGCGGGRPPPCRLTRWVTPSRAASTPAQPLSLGTPSFPCRGGRILPAPGMERARDPAASPSPGETVASVASPQTGSREKGLPPLPPAPSPSHTKAGAVWVPGAAGGVFESGWGGRRELSSGVKMGWQQWGFILSFLFFFFFGQ